MKTPGTGTPARQLSGGNLQKVVLGREFSGKLSAHENQSGRRLGQFREQFFDGGELLYARGGFVLRAQAIAWAERERAAFTRDV